MKRIRMTNKETIAALEMSAVEHHEILHRLVTLIDTLQDRVMRLEARVSSIYDPEVEARPRHTH